jgi:hypothetical protein
MSDTRWQDVKEIRAVMAALGVNVVGTDSGHWLDFSGCENIRISVSGTLGAGSYDVLACDLPYRPSDADNNHPSLLQGLPGTQLNWLQFQSPPHWVKFITTSVTNLSCGATADTKDAWRR